MNTDIRLQTSFLTHRKRKKLESRLGKTAVLSLIDLWLSVAVNKPKGILKDMDYEDIAMDANWDGDPKQFCDALVDIGFMDFKDGIYYIHDWKEHQSYAFHADERSELARKAALARWKKKEKKIEQNLDDNAEGMRDALPNDAEGMRIDAEGNAPSPTPSPTPSPAPSPSPVPDPSLKDNIADSVPESANLTIEDENENSNLGRRQGQNDETFRPYEGENQNTDATSKGDIYQDGGSQTKEPGSQTLLPGIGEQGTPGEGEGNGESHNLDDGKNGNASGDDARDSKSSGVKKPEEQKYRTKKNRWLKGQRLADFEEFWVAFDYKKGKAAAADSWLDIKDYSPEKAKWIIYAAKKEAWERDGIIQRGGTPKWCQGWLTDRRWEDYPMESQSSQKRRFKSKEEMKKEIYEKYGNPLLRETSSGEHKENASAGNNAGGYVPAGNALQVLFGKTI